MKTSKRGVGRAALRRAAQRTRRVRRFISIAIVSALAIGVGVSGVTAAFGATVYMIQGSWTSATPAVVSTGDAVVSQWRFNLNDDAAAPGNAPQQNVTLEFTAANAEFTSIPVACLVDGVTPISEVTANGTTLICNVGERAEGTAELLLTGVQVTGSTDDQVSISGSVGGVSATTSPLEIVNTFAMDIKFDEGNPSSVINGAAQDVSFPFALRHAAGSAAGPASVSYDLTFAFAPNAGEVMAPSVPSCTALTGSQAGYPNSGPGYDADRTAPFPTCTLTSVSSNRLRLTLSGIDYSKAQVPTVTSAGVALPSGWDVVASGLMKMSFTYVGGGTVSFTASTPTYTSVNGETSADLPDNNTNSRSYTRGTWTGGWSLSNLRPSVQGTLWTDTYRQTAGSPALSVSGVRAPTGTETSTIICTVLDTKYVEFEWARMGTISGGVVTPYAGTPVTYQYITGNGPGNILNPDNDAYNPNDFDCGNTSSTWTTTLPANLSTVKVVRVTIPSGTQVTTNTATLYTQVKIKEGTPIGRDIWTWTSYKMGSNNWFNPHRSMDPADRPASGVLTPALRYPYTGGGRDVLRVIGATPVVEKSVGQPESLPGATVGYTVRYRAQSPSSMVVPQFVLEDLLPEGTTYVPGSATVAPTSVTNSAGRTRLRWELPNVESNQDFYMHYSVSLPADADPGERYTNSVSASIDAQSATDSATVRIREGGTTFITKTALQKSVTHAGGVAHGGWTVRLSSDDSGTQTYTDTIDVLPHIGDGRGTDFSGTYALDGPIDVTSMAGATVYYTEASPALLSDDPAAPSNGSPGTVAGNTVGWSTVFTPDATAIRVIGGQLRSGQTHAFTVNIVTAGASYEDTYVNVAQARASRTQLEMRTSDVFDIAAARSVLVKKYVQAADGSWRDANNVDDYPKFHTGSDLMYRLVVTNTGDIALTDVALTDDQVDLATLDPSSTGLSAGAIIPTLLPGESNAVTIEYTVPLAGLPGGSILVNNACALPADTDVDQSCDPAGVIVLPSTLAWTKVAAGSSDRLAGSEWSLTPVDGNGEPVGPAVSITDCVAAAVDDCSGPDENPLAGEFGVTLPADGRYMLIETRSPAGYSRDATARFIEVEGAVQFAAPIENAQQLPLFIPLTGGTGADLILMTGGLLVVFLIALLLIQRKRSAAPVRELMKTQ